MPTQANSKKPKPPYPASTEASAMRTFFGVPVRASLEPAPEAKASGIRYLEGVSPIRSASRTTTGTKAATAPLMLMSGLRRATMRTVRTDSFRGLSPTTRDSHWPTQAVTPVVSSPTATMNSPAMKMITGSPKPAKAWFRSTRPVT